MSNFTGVVGVLERAAKMRPDLIFLISDASFQWRPGGGSSYKNIPYNELRKAVENIEEEARQDVPVQFIAFEPEPEDSKEWKRIIRRTGGDFRELKK